MVFRAKNSKNFSLRNKRGSFNLKTTSITVTKALNLHVSFHCELKCDLLVVLDEKSLKSKIPLFTLMRQILAQRSFGMYSTATVALII